MWTLNWKASRCVKTFINKPIVDGCYRNKLDTLASWGRWEIFFVSVKWLQFNSILNARRMSLSSLERSDKSFQWLQSFGDHQCHFDSHALCIYLCSGFDYTGILRVQQKTLYINTASPWSNTQPLFLWYTFICTHTHTYTYVYNFIYFT